MTNVFVGLRNKSPMAMNVVVVLVGTSCYRIFKSLKLFHFATDHNETSAAE